MSEVDVKVGGNARSMDEEQVKSEMGAGTDVRRQLISEDESAELTQAEHDRGLANRELNDFQKGMMGTFSGASLGFGPAGLIRGFQASGDQKNANLARHLMSGARDSDAHAIGQVGGFIGGSVITGGVLDELAATAKLGALLPEASGILGKTVQGAVTAGAKGSVEGALIGLGSAAEEAALKNKRLSAESVLAHMGEGALVGGGLGVVFGGAGGALRGVADAGEGSVSAALRKTKGIQEALETEGTRLKAPKGLMREIGSMEGGLEGFMSRADKALGIEGLSLADTPEKIVAAAGKLEKEGVRLKIEIANTFDKKAPMGAPAWSTVSERLRSELIGDALMSPAGEAQAKAVQDWLDKVAPHNMNLSKLEGGPGFEGWARNVGMFDNAPAPSKEVLQKAKLIYREELNKAMEAAEFKIPELKGQASNYRAMELQSETLRILRDINEGKLADFSTGTDLKKIAKTYGPDASEMVWKMGNASKITGAISQIKTRIAGGISEFMSTRNSVANQQMAKWRQGKPVERGDFSRENVDKQIETVNRLILAQRQEREQNYLKHTGSMALSSAMADVSERAAAYLAPMVPASQQVRQATKMRSVVQSVVLRPEEHKFLKHWGITKNPLSVLDDLKKGSLSKDAVATLKGVWPEIHAEMVAEATQQVAQMKAEGKTLPLDKITQLSILLDSPLDSTLSKTFIDPVQMALNEPPPAAPKPQPSGGPSSGEEYSTPAEEAMS